jgi:D-inositol-3-phosphate glycosyltransferase
MTLTALPLPRRDYGTSGLHIGVLSLHTSPLDQPGSGDGGGLNVSVTETSVRLAERGHHVDIFTRATAPHLPRTVSLFAHPAGGQVLVHHVAAGPPAPVPKAELANLLCAFLLAVEQHPMIGSHDVLHAHYWLSGWVGRRLAERHGTPLVQTFHTLGLMKNAHRAPGDAPESPLRLVAEAAVAQGSDRVTVLTCDEARLLHRAYGLSGAQIDVVPAGVDLSRFRPAGLRPAGQPPTLLFVGRLQRHKGPDVAVRTLAHVRQELPDAQLLIVGGASGDDPLDPDALRVLAQELAVAEAVELVPAVPQRQLPELYRAADVVLVPSRSETFGLVALEALACGIRVVAADVPGLQAVVQGGGTRVAGHDPVAYAQAALAYLRDPALAAAASREGLRTARRASWDMTVDRLLALYHELAGPRALAS